MSGCFASFLRGFLSVNQNFAKEILCNSTFAVVTLFRPKTIQNLLICWNFSTNYNEKYFFKKIAFNGRVTSSIGFNLFLKTKNTLKFEFKNMSIVGRSYLYLHCECEQALRVVFY